MSSVFSVTSLSKPSLSLSVFFFLFVLCVLDKKLAALHVHRSTELFRVNHLMSADAVNFVLNPIRRHDMQVSGSMSQQLY